MKTANKIKIAAASVLMLFAVNFIEAQALSVTIGSQTNVDCNGNCNGSLTALASGGTGGPYTYLWNPGSQTTANATGLCAGTYTVTADDGVTTATVTATILQPSVIAINMGSPQTLCSGTSVNICPAISGGTPAYTFVWNSSGAMAPEYTACGSDSPLSTTSYTLTVTDANNCTASSITIVTVSPNPVASIVSHAEPGCGNSDGTITGTANGSTGPYTYWWQPTANTTPVSNFLPTGTYTLFISDPNGCQDSLSYHLLDSCEVVWPGDADNDLLANNYDILDIGLYYGNTGNARPVQGNNWAGYPAENFSFTKPNGFNEKHDDCNGDGTIDYNDTTAVIQNYNFTHPAYKLIQQIMSGPPLTLQFVSDSVSNSSRAVMKINLGTGSVPANNIYGVALTLSIDTAVVRKDSTFLDVSNSWLSAGSPVFLHNRIENYSNSEIDIALTRTNHTNVSGNGEIVTVSMGMKDDISGKIMSTFAKTLHVTISKVKIISANGDTVSVSVSGDSITAWEVTTAIEKADNISLIKVFPNPAQDIVKIQSSKNNLKKLELYSIQGKIIPAEAGNNTSQLSSEMNLNVEGLEKGIYLLKIYTSAGIKNIRLQIQ